ncbi:MAG: bacteriophage holin [Alphaproteobacteria bacterium]|nr:bacteriophage holin [Alphaproteobacteria bacterium]
MNRCQPLALGVAIGVLWALYIGGMAIMAMFGWGTPLIPLLAALYIGYAATIAGAVIGALWAFLDGLVAGVVIAWIYNLIARQQKAAS